MGTSFTCIEKKNLANNSYVLPHSSRKLSTDISPVSTMKIWRVSRKTRSCIGAHVQSYKCVALAKSNTSNLKSFYTSR